MDRILTALLVGFVALLTFAGTALAAGAVAPDEGNLLDLAKPVFEAVMAGQYWYAAAGALVLVVALVRRFGPKWFPRALGWVDSSWGTPLLVLVASFGGAMATALAAGSSPSLNMAWVALGVAVTAAGGYKLLKELAVPTLSAIRDKLPPWAQPIVSALLWVFRSRQDSLETAQAAGDAAVAENPPTGVAGIVGEPRDVP